MYILRSACVHGLAESLLSACASAGNTMGGEQRQLQSSWLQKRHVVAATANRTYISLTHGLVQQSDAAMDTTGHALAGSSFKIAAATLQTVSNNTNCRVSSCGQRSSQHIADFVACNPEFPPDTLPAS